MSKVGTLNVKMLDHLREIRDNPVRLQLLEHFEKENHAHAGFAACFVAQTSMPSAPEHKGTQRER